MKIPDLEKKLNDLQELLDATRELRDLLAREPLNSPEAKIAILHVIQAYDRYENS